MIDHQPGLTQDGSRFLGTEPAPVFVAPPYPDRPDMTKIQAMLLGGSVLVLASAIQFFNPRIQDAANPEVWRPANTDLRAGEVQIPGYGFIKIAVAGIGLGLIRKALKENNHLEDKHLERLIQHEMIYLARYAEYQVQAENWELRRRHQQSLFATAAAGDVGSVAAHVEADNAIEEALAERAAYQRYYEATGIDVVAENQAVAKLQQAQALVEQERQQLKASSGKKRGKVSAMARERRINLDDIESANLRFQAQSLLKALEDLQFEDCGLIETPVLGNMHYQFTVAPSDLGDMKGLLDCRDELNLILSLPKKPIIRAADGGGVMFLLPRHETTIYRFPDFVTPNPTLRHPKAIIGIDNYGKVHWYELNAKSLNGIITGGYPGSGKSSGMYAKIGSLVATSTMETFRLVLFDGKDGDEFGYMANSPILLYPPAINPEQARDRLYRLAEERTRRSQEFARLGEVSGIPIRNLEDYLDNYQRFAQAEGFEPIPYLGMFVDEAQNMLNLTGSAKTFDLEGEDGRGVQFTDCEMLANEIGLWRSKGGLWDVSTQNPSRETIPTAIQSKCPNTCAYAAKSSLEANIMGCPGAEDLQVESGDSPRALLWKFQGSSEPVLLQSVLCLPQDIMPWLERPFVRV